VIEKLPNLTLRAYGRGKFVTAKPPEKEDVKFAEEALNLAKEVISSGEYDVVILDEVNVALSLKLIRTAKVLNLIKIRPPYVELVLTGRSAPYRIIEVADLVTEMKEIKHPFTKGFPARKGIEY
jgi:cob(I)alamin adenosyltransferase